MIFKFIALTAVNGTDALALINNGGNFEMIELGLNKPDGDGKAEQPKKRQAERFVVSEKPDTDTVQIIFDHASHQSRIQNLTSIEARRLAEQLIEKANLLERRASLDWELALQHFREVREQYTKLVGVPGTNSQLALQAVFRPLMTRFLNGERSPELFREMMNVG